MKRISVIFLFFQACLLQADPIHLLYFTDAHQIYPVQDIVGGRGGVARLKTIADNARAENPNTLLIHGGDLAGGVLFGGMYKGFPMIQAFNQIPIDLCNFGQHEFDFGPQVTRELIEQSDFQWLTTNLIDQDNNSFRSLPKFVVKEQNGMKIAFLGLTDAMDTTWDHEDVHQEDLFSAVSETLPQLGSVDLIVAITQTKLSTNRALLEQFPSIDIILTEEQYEYSSNVFYQGSRPIVATAGNMSSIASVRIESDRAISISMIPLDSTVSPHSDLLKTEQFYLNEVDRKLSEKVAELNTHLNFRQSNQGESLVGNLVTDAFREYHKSDVGLLNSGSIRGNHAKGDITMKSIRVLLPYGNKVCKIAMKGKDLRELLKKNAGYSNGQLLHVSGICYEYSRPKDEIKVFWKGEKLRNEEVVTVSTSSYFLSKIKVPLEILIGPEDKLAIEDYNALKQYCSKKGVLTPKIEGRIVRRLY